MVACIHHQSNLDFKGKVFAQILDDHDKEGQLDAKRLLRIRGTCDECCAVDYMIIKWCDAHQRTHLTLVPAISITRLWISLSVMRFMCPFLTWNEQLHEIKFAISKIQAAIAWINRSYKLQCIDKIRFSLRPQQFEKIKIRNMCNHYLMWSAYHTPPCPRSEEASTQCCTGSRGTPTGSCSWTWQCVENNQPSNQIGKLLMRASFFLFYFDPLLDMIIITINKNGKADIIVNNRM